MREWPFAPAGNVRVPHDGVAATFRWPEFVAGRLPGGRLCSRFVILTSDSIGREKPQLRMKTTTREPFEPHPLTTLFLIITALLAISSRANSLPLPAPAPACPKPSKAIDSARVTNAHSLHHSASRYESGAILTYLAAASTRCRAALHHPRRRRPKRLAPNRPAARPHPHPGTSRRHSRLWRQTLFHNRARDFGFSKTPEETEKSGATPSRRHGRVIREFRPNIVIQRLGGVHEATAITAFGYLTTKAVEVAADPKFLLIRIPCMGRIRLRRKDPRCRARQREPKGYSCPSMTSLPSRKILARNRPRRLQYHRSQGISAFLSSPFLHRPLALLPKTAAARSHSLAIPLTEPLGSHGRETCKTHPEACEKLRKIDAPLLEARFPVAESGLAPGTATQLW